MATWEFIRDLCLWSSSLGGRGSHTKTRRHMYTHAHTYACRRKLTQIIKKYTLLLWCYCSSFCPSFSLWPRGLTSAGHKFYLREQYCHSLSRYSDTIVYVTIARQDNRKTTLCKKTMFANHNTQVRESFRTFQNTICYGFIKKKNTTTTKFQVTIFVIVLTIIIIKQWIWCFNFACSHVAEAKYMQSGNTHQRLSAVFLLDRWGEFQPAGINTGSSYFRLILGWIV